MSHSVGKMQLWVTSMRPNNTCGACNHTFIQIQGFLSGKSHASPSCNAVNHPLIGMHNPAALLGICITQPHLPPKMGTGFALQGSEGRKLPGSCITCDLLLQPFQVFFFPFIQLCHQLHPLFHSFIQLHSPRKWGCLVGEPL